MAKFEQGILGGFSGTVGTVVGGNWKGIDYMRAKATTRKSGSSIAQDVHRAKFSVATKFLRAIKDLISIGYPNSVKMSATNRALANTLKDGVTGVYPDLKIDYEKMRMTDGNLRPVKDASVASTEPGIITFEWLNNESATGRGSDKAILIAYCEEEDDCYFSVDAGTRAGKGGKLAVNNLTGKTVHTWVAFTAEVGNQVSPSKYVGTAVVS